MRWYSTLRLLLSPEAQASPSFPALLIHRVNPAPVVAWSGWLAGSCGQNPLTRNLRCSVWCIAQSQSGTALCSGTRFTQHSNQ